MEEVFKKADISGGVNVDGENLTNLRFADDVALFNKTNGKTLKGTAKSKVMLQLMHSMCKSYYKTVVYFIQMPSVLRKKAT